MLGASAGTTDLALFHVAFLQQSNVGVFTWQSQVWGVEWCGRKELERERDSRPFEFKAWNWQEQPAFREKWTFYFDGRRYQEIGVDIQTGRKLVTPFFKNSIVCIWGIPFYFLFLLFSFCFPGIPVSFGGSSPLSLHLIPVRLSIMGVNLLMGSDPSWARQNLAPNE